MINPLNPLVFIVVLNWNGRQYLQDCLSSLLAIEYSNFEILLVDNNSHDGSISFVKSSWPNVKIIRNDKNLGFSEGNNVGIRYALSHDAKYVVLLNNDTRVKPDFLSQLIKRGEEKADIGVLGGRVMMFNDPHIINSTGVNLNQFAYGWDRDFAEENVNVKTDGGEVLGVSGCLMAIKKEVFNKIGLLDPEYFAYLEDVDFCIRVWKQTDFKVEYVPASVIYHKFSASFSETDVFKSYLMTRNQYRLFFKHFPFIKIVGISPLFYLNRLGRLFGNIKRKEFKLFFKGSYLFLKYFSLLPYYLFRRVPDSIMRSAKERLFWTMLVPEKKGPVIKNYLSSRNDIR